MFVNCFYGGAIFQSVELKFFCKLQVFKKNSLFFFFYINHWAAFQPLLEKAILFWVAVGKGELVKSLEFIHQYFRENQPRQMGTRLQKKAPVL